VTSGRTKTIIGTNPAANVECSDTVPAGSFWMLRAYSVSLAQGATQTPRPTLIIDDGTNTLFEGVGASSIQNASVTCLYSWGPGSTLTAGGASTTAFGPIPYEMILGPGYRIRTSTAGKGANTDYGAPNLMIVEYSHDPYA
jgi:hypothetical protein